MNIKFKTDKEWESTERIGVYPFRSHYIPFGSGVKPSYIHNIIDKTSSDEFINLNGTWLFEPHKSIEEILYVDEELTHQIDVPSCVQCRGFDYFQYINFTYPFPFNPPYVPNENPVFHYRRTFEVSEIKNLFLVFEGVDSAFYIYVNGQYIGYSQISHSKSEFNITNFAKTGLNTIDVFVLKWCASSYLEDQDKFRFTGIFRDVYLLNRPKGYIWDYKIETIYDNKQWFLKVTNLSKEPISIRFKHKDYLIEANQSKPIYVFAPKLWSAKKPFLYDVIVYNEVETIYEKIGFRDVKIKNKIFTINGDRLKLKGVNRHESNPYNGATVSIEDTFKDLKIIKELNANAIRTSHYPDIPEFYELCDTLGIYVVDEADLESHGAVQEGYNLEKWQAFANNGIFDRAVYYREQSLYEQDKNRTCVVIWSLGNESNWGKMFYGGADYIHAHDSRPIHYEGIFNLVDKTDYHTKRIDINSMMYPSFETIKERYLDDPQETRPLMLCEYTHAMGNSCGDVKDYWDFINAHDEIIGAFVWEFCDHAVIVDGKLKYGNDFPEHQNDKNFCVDGMVSPFRELKSSALEIQAVYKNTKSPQITVKMPKITPNMNKVIDLVFNPKLAQITKLDNILKSPIDVCFTRANIDNEMYSLDDIALFRKPLKSIQKISDDTSKITYKTEKKETLITLYEKVEVIGDVCKIILSYERNPKFYMQRVGIRFSLNSLNAKCIYHGFGPGESYIDKHNYCKVGSYSFNVKENIIPYLKPQDYGSHYLTSLVEFDDLLISADQPFSFSALPNSEEDLLNCAHDYDLPKRDEVFLNLDIAMAGVGSHACGPVLSEKYCVPEKGTNIFYIKIKK